eukprot:15471849-Alexandrium_andersonii.AAC.1
MALILLEVLRSRLQPCALLLHACCCTFAVARWVPAETGGRKAAAADWKRDCGRQRRVDGAGEAQWR